MAHKDHICDCRRQHALFDCCLLLLHSPLRAQRPAVRIAAIEGPVHPEKARPVHCISIRYVASTLTV